MEVQMPTMLGAIAGAVVILIGCAGTPAQRQPIVPDLAQIPAARTWTVINIDAENVEVDGRRAVHLVSRADSANGIVGLALVDGLEFSTGVIDVDLKGKSIRGNSFLGVAFNVADDKTFESVYFRPFNFKADPPFRDRAVQYIAWPAYTWEKLRKERTGEFESAIHPLPDPDRWFHARVEVGPRQVRVFVDGAQEPTLVTTRLAENGKGRRAGLFVDSADGFYANLKFTPAL
jgi:hypothetical protein